nr:zinc finger, CCHC-type [Tanacetum cinerariifolium]
MGGSSSQPRTKPAMSLINAFLVEELYTPEFLDSFHENTGYWQQPSPHEYPVEQVATSPTKKKATRYRQKRTIESDDAPRQTAWTTKEEITLAKGSEGGSKRHKSSSSSSFNTEDKARAAERKNKGSKSAGSSNVNEDALARLMVTEMTAHEKEERLAFLDIKRKEVECLKRELKQQDIRDGFQKMAKEDALLAFQHECGVCADYPHAGGWSHLRIEESLRVHDSDKPKGNNVAGPSVVNMVEHNNSSRYNDNKGKQKYHDTKDGPNKKPKVSCWKYGKPGHLKRDYKGDNVNNKANGSGTKGSGDGSSNPLKDYSSITKVCAKDMYPLPEEGEGLASLMGYPYKCFLRFMKEYSQIRMAEGDEEKTGFYTKEGEGRFLGHMVIKEGLRADPGRIHAIILSPTPRSPNQIQSLFLQLTAIGKFISKLAELKHPIHEARMKMEKQKNLARQMRLKKLSEGSKGN